MKSKKKLLRREADKLWFNKVMEKWNWKSVISGKIAQQVHHFFPKGRYGHLRYGLDNGIPLTMGEHFTHHHIGDPTIQQRIIEKLGKKWYNKLRKKSQEKHYSYITIKWYQDNIKKLS